MKKTASTDAAGCRMDGAQDAKKEILVNMRYFAPNQPTPVVQDWNFTLEKEIMRNTVARLGYVGNHGANQESGQSFGRRR